MILHKVAIVAMGIAVALTFYTVFSLMWPMKVTEEKRGVEYNCADFTSQKYAQDIFSEYKDDIYKLDGDHDGVACESLL